MTGQFSEGQIHIQVLADRLKMRVIGLHRLRRNALRLLGIYKFPEHFTKSQTSFFAFFILIFPIKPVRLPSSFFGRKACAQAAEAEHSKTPENTAFSGVLVETTGVALSSHF